MTRLKTFFFLIFYFFISACGEPYEIIFFENYESENFYSEYDFSKFRLSYDHLFDGVYFAIDVMKIDHSNYQIRLDFFSDTYRNDYEIELSEVNFIFPKETITIADGKIASFDDYLNRRDLYKGQIKLLVISEGRVGELLGSEGGFNVVVKLKRGTDKKSISFYLRKIVRGYQSFPT